MKCLESVAAKSLLHSGERLTVESYKHIIYELETLSQENIVYVSNLLNEVKLKAVDDAARCHYLTLHLGLNYPSTPPIIQADLPEKVAMNLKRVSMHCEAVVRYYHPAIFLVKIVENASDLFQFDY